MRPEVLATQVAETIRGVFSPLVLRLAALENATEVEVGEVRARLAVLEAQGPLPGPPGPPGAPGRDGRDGIDGKDGKGLTYLGVHVTGKSYDVGDLVTAGGSAWYCGKATTTTPGSSSDWQLMVKRGRDARGDR